MTHDKEGTDCESRQNPEWDEQQNMVGGRKAKKDKTIDQKIASEVSQSFPDGIVIARFGDDLDYREQGPRSFFGILPAGLALGLRVQFQNLMNIREVCGGKAWGWSVRGEEKFSRRTEGDKRDGCARGCRCDFTSFHMYSSTDQRLLVTVTGKKRERVPRILILTIRHAHYGQGY